MAVKAANSETISNVKFEYLTDWDNRFAPKGIKDAMKSWAKQIAPSAEKRGYKRVQIGSLGDFHDYGIGNKLIAINTMFAFRLLKR